MYFITSRTAAGDMPKCTTSDSGKTECNFTVSFEWHQSAQCCGWKRAEDWIPPKSQLPSPPQKRNHSSQLPLFCCALATTTPMIDNVLYLNGLTESQPESCSLHSMNRFQVPCKDIDASFFEQFYQLNIFAHLPSSFTSSLLYSVFKMDPWFCILWVYSFTPQKEKDEHEIQRALDPNGTNSQLKHLQIIDYDTALQRIAWTNESKELAQLKPILRFILKCMVHVFLFDDFIAHAYNLFFGGLLIYRLLNCKELVRADQSHAFARLSNVCLYIGAILLRVASLWVYETETVSALLHPEGALSLFVILLKLFFESLFFILHFISLSMNSMWFAYCLLMVTTSIEQLQQEMMQIHDLDELTLSRLCTRLTRLHGHFQFIVTYFTVPITLSFVSTTINLIASCCFMIIGNQQLKIESTASSFIFCIGTLSLARLLLVCVVGDMPSDAVGRLVLTVYECKAEWTTNEWMHYRAVKRFKRDFRVIMLRVVFVRQSSILAVLAKGGNRVHFSAVAAISTHTARPPKAAEQRGTPLQ
ncbi:hypothetical protein TYRP_019049 [Tyrophagus putrescentiae]|nr:hypothetical protein TYRP_019049 [Tyrophagus putrescentiae]